MPLTDIDDLERRIKTLEQQVSDLKKLVTALQHQIRPDPETLRANDLTNAVSRSLGTNDPSTNLGELRNSKGKSGEQSLWVAAPAGTGHEAARVLGVHLSENEDVCWIWTHNADGSSFVSGYKIVDRDKDHDSK